MEPEDKKSNGALVGSIIIVVILIIGGIYIWQSQVKKVIEEEAIENQLTEENNTELESLEAELEGLDTNLDVQLEGVN